MKCGTQGEMDPHYRWRITPTSNNVLVQW